MKELLQLEPLCTHNIWGGERLKTEFNYDVPGKDIGECWGIAANSKGDLTIKNGRFKGKKLSSVWKENPELFGNQTEKDFPLLTKIIDAKDNLSIQVHPDDKYAKLNENGANGKTECWYVIDCPVNASLVIGHNAKTKEELVSMIEEERWNELIREIPVKKGDFIQIDPGTVHTIKAGMLILEIQQNSDLTYRVYDYDRLQNGKLRELHVKKSIDVITVPSKSMESSLIDTSNLKKNRLNELYKCSFYRIFKLNLEGECSFDMDYPFMLASVINGEGKIDSYPLKKGDHFIIPNGYGKVCLEGNMEFIFSSIS